MTTIRRATDGDIDGITEMAKRFYPASPYPALYGEMPESQAAGLAIITMHGSEEFGIDAGVMLVAEKGGELVGMLCLHADRATFNPACRVTSELVLWIEPEHRGGMLAVRLVKAGEAMARNMGIHVNRMAMLSTSPEETADLYRKLGYVQTETYFSKRLD